MDFSDSSTFSTASGKDYHYVVLQVAGTGAEKFFLQSNLQDNVMIVLAGCGGESRGIAEIHK